MSGSDPERIIPGDLEKIFGRENLATARKYLIGGTAVTNEILRIALGEVREFYIEQMMPDYPPAGVGYILAAAREYMPRELAAKAMEEGYGLLTVPEETIQDGRYGMSTVRLSAWCRKLGGKSEGGKSEGGGGEFAEEAGWQ